MKNHKSTIHPTADPAMQALLKRLNPAIANSFTTEQLCALASVVGARGGRLHAVDVRSTIKLPFIPFSFYLVFLMGRNRRTLSKREQTIAVFSLFLFVTISFTLAACFTVLMLYLVKSALGIDLISGFSLGIWQWYNS